MKWKKYWCIRLMSMATVKCCAVAVVAFKLGNLNSILKILIIHDNSKKLIEYV